MDITTLHRNLDIVVDKLATASYPDIPEEIKDWALNEAQIRIVKSRDRGNNPHQQGFQETQHITDELSVLVKELDITPTPVSTGNPKIYKVQLLTINNGVQDTLLDGNKYLRFIRCDVQTSNSKCAEKWVEPKEVNLVSLGKVLKDPFNKPTIENPIITFVDGGVRIYADSTFNVNKLKLTYLKMPIEMSIFDNVSCELPESLHSEIVNLAAEILLEGIESQRLQTNMILNQKQ